MTLDWCKNTMSERSKVEGVEVGVSGFSKEK